MEAEACRRRQEMSARLPEPAALLTQMSETSCTGFWLVDRTCGETLAAPPSGLVAAEGRGDGTSSEDVSGGGCVCVPFALRSHPISQLD